MKDGKLLQALREHKLLSEAQLRVVLEEQNRTSDSLARLVVRLGFVEAAVIPLLLSEITGWSCVRLEESPPDPACLQLFHLDIMKRDKFCVWARESSTVKVAMTDPFDLMTQDRVREHLRTKLGNEITCSFVLVSQEDFDACLQTFCKGQIVTDDSTSGEVDTLLSQALESGASDIHFHPTPHVVHVRFRIDGHLQTVHEFHKSSWAHIIIRLKVLSNLDIAESRRPQSGHFEQILHGQKVDFRVSTHPTIHGESLVIRLLARHKKLLSLEQLGFEDDTTARLKKLIQKPYGLILLCGPTGSGKTTTLYALCALMDAQSKNIMTLEDPVEYAFDHIRQTEIQSEILNFAEGVRSLLRQDPDILLLGEIRDEETAQMALRASMSGHLVLATIHANNVLSAPGRLQDLGLRPSLLAGQILAIMSQRLVRRYCLHCKGKGCLDCHQQGYKGRLAISELLEITEPVDACLANTRPWDEWKQCAEAHGYVPLYHDGLLKVKKGLTSLTEVNTVCGREGESLL